jgi:excisionase family DNA binding protein
MDDARDRRTISNRPNFYTVGEAARMLRVSPMTVYRAIADSQFPAVRLRSRLIIPASFVDEMVSAALESKATVSPADWAV